MRTVALTTISFLLLVSCSLQKVSDNAEPIKIGVVASLTGPGAFYGQNIRKGVELAIDEINQQGGTNGRLFSALYEDDATNPKQTVSAALKLIEVNNVKAIIGVQWDFLANAVIPIANDKKIVMISAAAPFDSLLPAHQESPYFFTTFPSAIASQHAVKRVLEVEQVKTAVIIATNNDWGLAHTRAYKEAAQLTEVKILETFLLSKTEQNDLRTIVSKAKELNPDVLMLVMNDADNIDFVRRYRELGLTAAVVAHENFSDPLYTGRLPIKDAEGFYFFEYPDPDPAFVQRFETFHNEKPQIAADTAYDAVYSLKRAVESSGSMIRGGIAEGMREVSFEGASGPIDFTSSNYPEGKKAVLKRIEDGKVVVVE